MRILLTVHHFPPSRVAGAELFAYRLAQGLLTHGHQVQVVCVEPESDAPQNSHVTWHDELFDEIPVRRLVMNLQHAPSDPLSFDNPQIVAALTELLQSRSFDLIHHISGYLLGVAPLRAAQSFALPTIVSLTDFWFLCPTIQLRRGDGSLCFGPEPLECLRCAHDARRRFRSLDERAPALVRNFWRTVAGVPLLNSQLGITIELAQFRTRANFLRQHLNQATVIAPVTHFLGDLHGRNGIDTSRVQVMPFGIEPMQVAQRQPDGALHFGYLGQIAPIKGVAILVEAFRKLDLRTHSVKLFIHGNLDTFPEYSAHSRQLAQGNADIIWAGPYKPAALPTVLQNLDAIVVPSLWHENSPHVVLEAFAARRPVIGSDVGGIAELVKHNANGLLFPLGDVTALTRQMQRLLDEPDLLPNLRAQIPTVVTTDQELESWLALYQTTAHPVPAPVA